MRIVHFVKEKFSTRGIAVSFKQAEVLAVLCPISVNWHNNPQLWMSMEMRSNSTWSAQLRWCVEQNWQLNRRDLNILIMKTSYLETKHTVTVESDQITSYWNEVLSQWFMMRMCQVNHMLTHEHDHANFNQTMSSPFPLTNCPFVLFILGRQQKKKPKKKFDFSKRISSWPTIFLICFSMSAHTLCPVRFQEPQIILQFSVEKRNSHYSKDDPMQFSYIAIARMLILSNGI